MTETTEGERSTYTAAVDRRRPYLVVAHKAKCPNGHRLKDGSAELVLEDSVHRCGYKYPARNGRGYDGECGALMLMVAGMRGRDGVSRLLVVPVTLSDIRRIQEERMSLDEELNYLGMGPPQ